MQTLRSSLLLSLAFQALTLGALAASEPGRAAAAPAFDASTLPDPLPAIVLKLDDLMTRTDSIPPAWKRVTDFARERNIKLSIGIIANSLEGDKPVYFEYIKELRRSGVAEFWFHGYDHRQWKEGEVLMQEFKGTSYEHQKEHFVKSQRLAQEKLGFTFSIFGAPFNGFDENTSRVLQEDSDIKIFLYGKPGDKSSGKIILDRVFGVNIEDPTFIPNVDKFIAGYVSKAKGRRVYVIQGHPGNWTDERWAGFVHIVDFLQQHHIPVITAAEAADTLTAAKR